MITWTKKEVERKSEDGAFAEMVTKASCKRHGDNREITLITGWYYMRTVNLASVMTGLELSKNGLR